MGVIRSLFIVANMFFGYSAVASPASISPSPFADVHLHFNWDQKEIISASEVVDKLKAQNVTLAVASSTPTSLVLELKAAANGSWLIPYFSPYTHPLGKNDWFLNKSVLDQARQGLKSKVYAGIGEVHMWSNKSPRINNQVFQGLLNLAQEFTVPFYLHTESSNEQFMLSICKPRPKIRFLWAHGGGILKPRHLEKVLQTCANVWIELSTRDPWRYDTLLDENKKLPKEWVLLLTSYPNRFMTGTDPVWNVTKLTHWDEADEGWDHYEKLLKFHREWLQQLPSEIEEKIRLSNAIKFFTRK
jgi:hypothetical protein